MFWKMSVLMVAGLILLGMTTGCDQFADSLTTAGGAGEPGAGEPGGGGPGEGGPGGWESPPVAGNDDSGSFMPAGATEEFADWWGVIGSTEPGTQFDDYFERQDLGQIIYFGIESQDPAVQAQIEALRDTGQIVHLWGTLYSNVPDYNGSQVQVTRIEVEK